MKEKNKIKILDFLNEEYQRLTSRREEVMQKVDTERDEYEEDNPNPILDECVIELQSIVEHIFHLENAIRYMRNNASLQRKKGETVKIGDIVTVKDNNGKRQLYISHSSDYVNPSVGIISPNSPIGQALLGSKIGEKINVQLNGNLLSYELAT